MGLNNRLIIKEAVGNYNPADHSMEWRITVNPNLVDLTEAEIFDDIGAVAPEHTFIPDGKTEAEVRDEVENAVGTALAGAGVPASVLAAVELKNEALKINLGALGKKSFSFTLTTYARNPEFWASNSSASFPNTVVMKQSGTKVGGTPVAADSSASAAHTAASSVLEKNHTGYDADTKKIIWQLTVNKNNTNLGDVTVEDSLPAGLSIEPEDIAAAKIDGTAFVGDSRFSVGSDGKLTVTLKNVTARHEITFPTTVDTDSDAFLLNQEVNFRNSARLQSGANSSWVSGTESVAVLDNKILEKSSNHLPGGTKVSYTVSLNPIGTDLLKGIASGSGLYVTDTLDDGLYLDLDSVRLFQADRAVQKNGGKYTVTLSKKAGGAEAASVSYNAKANSFSVEIPDSTASYLLEYDAYIVRSGLDLSNHVSLEGGAIPAGSGNQDAQASFYISSFGGASFRLPADKFFSMQIKKVDESGAKLSGAEFGLYKSRSEDALLVAAGCDDSTGICSLAVPKSQIAGIDTLYWKERKAPAGYELNDEWKEVKANPAPDAVFTVTNVTAASAASGKVNILKVDKDSRSPLPEAEFRLYTDQECLTPAGDALKTGIDGAAAFDHLYPTRNYWLKETAAPDGYDPQKTSIKVTADSGPSPAPYVIENEEAKASVTITVTEAGTTGLFLKGAKYQLYFDRACLRPAGPLMETGADGKLTFSGLQPHFIYYMKMAAPADGYELDAQIYTISTKENSIDVPVHTESNQIGWDAKAVLTVKKTNEPETTVLEGAVFQLYREDRATLCGEQTTAENGECSFEKLKEGAYYLREIRAPEGYQLDGSWIPVQIDRNTDRAVTVRNKRSLPPWSEGDSSGNHGGDTSKGPNVPGPVIPDTPQVPEPAVPPGDASDPLGGSPKATDKSDVMNAGISKEKKMNKTGIPKTGVKSFAGLWALGAIVSGLALAACLVLFARSRGRKNK